MRSPEVRIFNRRAKKEYTKRFYFLIYWFDWNIGSLPLSEIFPLLREDKLVVAFINTGVQPCVLSTDGVQYFVRNGNQKHVLNFGEFSLSNYI